MSEVKQSQLVVSGAKALCQHASVICGVDPEDNWKIYGDTFLEDAHVVLNAAGVADLLEALIDCRRALELANFTQELAVVNAAIVKATRSAA